MARALVTPARTTGGTDSAGDELPVELRPENWRKWLAEVNREPATEWEREAHGRTVTLRTRSRVSVNNAHSLSRRRRADGGRASPIDSETTPWPSGASAAA